MERGSSMGRFVNPNNSAFQVALNSRIYVDKTELIEYTNSVLGSEQRCICNSRPRRFGKSVTANMLTAYYSRGCDSGKMFEGLSIGGKEDFKEHLNRYDVIHFDLQWCIGPAGGADRVISYITSNIVKELRTYYPEELPQGELSLTDALSSINTATGRKFIVIIDEWDVLIRDEATNLAVQEEYIDFLRGMFKGVEPTKFIHLAYLTGILPIKKLKTQSALNNFEEYTMVSPGAFAPYVGFTEEEVRALCGEYGRDFEEVKRWYDGYLLGGHQVYNPKAVVSVMLNGEYQSYWSNTGTYESIKPFIDMDFDGLKTAILTMMSGDRIRVKTHSFQNDMVSFKNKDDILTLLIHLGYLAYDRGMQMAFIPNEEIRSEFLGAVEENNWNEFIEFSRESEAILEATLELDGEAVAEKMEKIHREYASAIQYNNENSLSSVLSIAYLSALQYYFKPIREMPAGRGFADFVLLPKAAFGEGYPALLVELKWNRDAETALDQIRERRYPESLKAYAGEILLVGMSYDKKSKEHQCLIERLKK